MDDHLAIVYMTPEVQTTCLTYGLCTEKEETLVLLAGYFGYENFQTIAHVTRSIVTTRKDKSKDRVEVDPEQMSLAMTEADSAGLNLVGWAHSHPHITVNPSHVDLRTQFNMQTLDPRFFGIIVSCFNNDAGTQRFQVTCFQTIETEHGQIERVVPLLIRPANPGLLVTDGLTQVQAIPRQLFKEEAEGFDNRQCGPTTGLAAHLCAGIHTHTLSNLVDKMTGPMLTHLKIRYDTNMKQIEMLDKRRGTRSSI
ncbi:lys-63-specific deubiquitinase BRCC36-like protein [Polychytrium aggregatum]|uniref:lys-63-specific deubiquitinase BRCC36-like protein n=1 Tax=Polychytrium aggregatum TaxID=110093 RepID=UPI0022FF429B|nr:lys-63-specific deubiquitinase BRCC36-like protein [Polychytrium aggregatum]KAI9206715.1 lys-63-specific deubiquitinase BRCC36-like protein [Polychytrium aggregatum]